MLIKNKAVIFGLLGSLGLTLFYLIISFLLMPGPRAVWDNISQFWYLMIILIVGFGWQVGLAVAIKDCQRQQKTVVGVAGGMSSGAMLACCVHHLTDFLPLLGLSGAGIFLVQYQKPLLVLSVVINLLGLAYMLKSYSKVKLVKQNENSVSIIKTGF